jgi:hypothetical protein
MTLGMKFKESGRYYQSGDKKGQAIMVPDIKNKNDIPKEITKYFDCCYDFIKNKFGEENIVLAQVHYDEDTPHLQAYFLPIVNSVKRKSYLKDDKGNVIKEVAIGKDGSEKLVPKLNRDKQGKIIYETVKGKFLNNDQLWKDLGGKSSFANLQNEFNKFITEKGFRLDRGNIGSNKIHTDKLEYKKAQLIAELDNIKKDITLSKEELKKAENVLKNSINNNSFNEIDLKKKFTGYNTKDVEKLIEYSTKLKQLNDISKYDLESEQRKNFSLSKENDFYRNNKELIKMKQENHKQYRANKDLESDNDFLQDSLFEIAKALANTLKIKPYKNISSYLNLAKQINYSASHINQEMDKAADEFSKLFNNDDREL